MRRGTGRRSEPARGRARLVRAALAAAALLAAPAGAAAQGWIEPRPGFGGVEKLRTEVVVRVEGRVARIEVQEWFRNDGGGLAEGVYLYPLPGETAFSDFSLWQGEQELRGETMDADRARAIYEEIVRRKRDPALIELVGHGLVRASIFPIAPGETRKIALRYTQLLPRAGDALGFRYAASGRARGDVAPIDFTMIVEDAAAFRDPFSPTHELSVRRDDERMRVRTEDDPRGDVAIFLPLANTAVGITVAAHRPSGGEDGYFMLTLSPGTVEGPVQPRDVTVVMDVSGSMSGAKIEQAKDALRQILGTLDERDRFRLIAFSNGVSTFADGWAPATARPLRDARAWIDRLRAEGGTNIDGALDEALRLDSPDGRLPIVIFVTDGQPTVGERDPERIAADAEADRGDARVFAFGVGYDVNTYLLDRLGAAGRGGAQYVQPDEDVERAVGTLANRISHPVLTDLRIAELPVDVTELYPHEPPDLFAGDELVVFGRYEAGGGGTGQVVIEGRRAGRAARFGADVAFPARAQANGYIPRLWASRKLGSLVRTLRLEGHDPELVEEIRATALRYGLLSEYTSYLVLEPEAVVADGGARFRSGAMPATPVAPPAPQASAGEAAVRGAERARARRETASVQALERSEALALDALVVTGEAATRVVAGRLFRERDGVWTDARHREDTDVLEIQAYSEAYFALLRKLPELEPVLGEFERLLVAGERLSIQIGDEGVERLSPGRLDDVARAFRGA